MKEVEYIITNRARLIPESELTAANAKIAELEARLREAEARADIWERNYAACGDKDLASIIAQKDKNWADYNAAIERAEKSESELEALAARWLEKSREEYRNSIQSETYQVRLAYSGLSVGREECAKALLDYLTTRKR